MLPGDRWTNKDNCAVAMNRDGIAGTISLSTNASFSAVSGQERY
jgi:hypothetical protein